MSTLISVSREEGGSEAPLLLGVPRVLHPHPLVSLPSQLSTPRKSKGLFIMTSLTEITVASHPRNSKRIKKYKYKIPGVDEPGHLHLSALECYQD
jgi:hypothetical protein